MNPNPTQPTPEFVSLFFPTMNPNPTQPIPDIDPETQPSSSRPKGKGKRKHTKKTTEVTTARTIERWTPEEELALAQAWVEVSEDPITGNEKINNIFFNL